MSNQRELDEALAKARNDQPSDEVVKDVYKRQLHGHIISVSVIPGTAEKGAPALEVNGEAEVESLLQNGHELLPSRVQELLDQPYGKRTAWFVFLGFVAFVMFKVVDRAFEVLLKLVLPGG